MKQQYNTALYLRLSRDDELKGESGSISTQRTMLTQYCKEQKMRIVGEYVDDGWSGTNFDRPNFQRMIDDIEDGKINLFVKIYEDRANGTVTERNFTMLSEKY